MMLPLLKSLIILLAADVVLSAAPNIFFILADDLGWNDVGFHGSMQIPTPNIDALAYSGVILNNYYVQPICTPSRSALMTGLHPIHTGLQHNTIIAAEPYGMPLNITTLPSHLNELGYVSRHIGKWHLGLYQKEFTPTFRGFKSHYGYWSGRTDYYDHTAYDDPGYWGYDFRRDMDVDRSAFGKYTTDLLTNEAVSIIGSHNVSQPLFLYLAHLAVHSGNLYDPLQAPASVVDRFKDIEDENRRKFAGMLTKLDEGVGLVVEALEQRQMLENSIIIFSTDNGGPAAGFNQNAASNWPFRGVKASAWEGGVRGAGLIWSPLINNPGRVSMDLMQIMDWFPTLITAAGGESASLPTNDGLNMWHTIVNGSASPRTEILHNIDPISNQRALRMGDWKIISYPDAGYGVHWNSWFGPSGRNETVSHDIHNLNSIRDSDGKRKRNIGGLTKKAMLWDTFKDILESPAGKAIKRSYPKAFRNMHQSRADAEILCDPIPSDAVVSCNNTASPCLFHIPSDPCEYYDVSIYNLDVVATMQIRLAEYEETVVYPIKTPADPLANPVFWDYTWTNWRDYPQPQVSSEMLKKMTPVESEYPDQI